MRHSIRRFLLVTISACPFLAAATIDTTNAATVAAFQAGATVVTFESIGGVTPLSLSAYTNGVAIPPAANLFNQVAGVQFSVGGNPGSNATEPVVVTLTNSIAGNAHSATNVLAPADMAGNTAFNGFIEIYFPTKVAKVGFWLNPGLGNVSMVAKSDQVAFSHSGGTETILGTLVSANAGDFVGFQDATADIAGVTINLAGGSNGFTIDDLTFGGAGSTNATPEPATFGVCLLAFGALWGVRRRTTGRA